MSISPNVTEHSMNNLAKLAEQRKNQRAEKKLKLNFKATRFFPFS